ncbi:MAG: hypothetical protein E6G44_10790 [Actinobacteria bacterium]|nr:MAG: hypothetical protein E6G44_10790 [Actinomycetota bacterium]
MGRSSLAKDGPPLGRLKESLARNWWTLQRFGLSPGKIPLRFRNKAEPRVFCVSIPKAGTHLLERALCLHPRLYRTLIPTVLRKNMDRWEGLEGILRRMKPGQVVMSHLLFEPAYAGRLRDVGVPLVFMIRDPRDILLAHVFNITRSKRNPFHDTLTSRPELRDRIVLVIEGDPAINLPSMAFRLERFAGWLDAGGLVVRFEDLVGPAGGGSAERQAAALRSLFTHLRLPAGDGLIDSIAGQLFSSRSPTFRRGATGDWARYLDAELRDLFFDRTGDLMARYGYGRGGPS